MERLFNFLNTPFIKIKFNNLAMSKKGYKSCAFTISQNR